MSLRLPRPSVMIVSVLVLASACSRSEPDRVSTDPESLEGFQEELGALVPDLLSAYSVPGAAVGIIHDGEIWAKTGFGHADVASARRVDAGTAFNIGSISKTVASWGVLKLVEAGAIDLDRPVSDYLTRWQLPDSEFDHEDVTMRRLLSHTAGLSLHGYPGFEPGELLPTVEESLSGATNGPGGVFVAHEPGSRWQYSGGGYTMAQLIVEEVSGEPFAAYMTAEVLEPLGMTSSSYVWDEGIDEIAATPYDGLGEPIGGPRFTAMAAAGLQTTLDDFTRFALASVGALDGSDGTAGVLKRETVTSMQVPVEPADDYGLGYQIDEQGEIKIAGHGGANQGWMAYLSVAPETGDGIVVMTNGSNGSGVHRAITCAWLDRVTGERCKPVPGIPVAVEDSVLERVQGVYQIPDGPALDLRVVAGRLFAHADGDRMLVLPKSDTEFFLAAAPVSLEFEIGDDGEATVMWFRQGDEEAVKVERVH